MFAQLSSFALAKLAGFARKAFGVEPAQSQTRHCEERKRRSNPAVRICHEKSSIRSLGLLRYARNDGNPCPPSFQVLLATSLRGANVARHCEERSDEAIQQSVIRQWIASPSARNDDLLIIVMTSCLSSQ